MQNCLLAKRWMPFKDVKLCCLYIDWSDWVAIISFSQCNFLVIKQPRGPLSHSLLLFNGPSAFMRVLVHVKKQHFLCRNSFEYHTLHVHSIRHAILGIFSGDLKGLFGFFSDLVLIIFITDSFYKDLGGKMCVHFCFYSCKHPLLMLLNSDAIQLCKGNPSYDFLLL